MDLKKLAFSDQLLSSHRKKLVTPFGLCILVSFILLSAVLLSISPKGPFLYPVFQALYSLGAHSNSSSVSCSSYGGFVGSGDNITVVSGCNGTGIVGGLVNGTLEGNGTGSVRSIGFVGSEKGFEKARIGDESEGYKDGNFIVRQESFDVKTDEGNVTRSVNSNSVSVDDLIGNVEKNGSVGGEGNRDAEGENVSSNNSSVAYEHSSDGAKVRFPEDDGSVGNDSDRGVSGGLRNGSTNATGANDRSYKRCDIFNGRWVRDDTKPYYPPGSCPYIDRDFDCHLNGRPDSEFVKWRWQPYDCDIPRFNATDFLERLRGKKLVFVGDSLNRNMWESLVCLLRHGVEDKNRVYEISGRHEFKKKGFYAFRFEDYDCSVDFVSSPFLVKESIFKGKNGSSETLRLDLMDETTHMYHDADVIIFNTGHWWTHEKTSRGEGYYQEGGYVHPRLKVLEAYKRALTTWSSWVDKNIDSNKTEVIFRGYSVTHFRGGPWNSGGQCHKETEPIFNEAYLAKYPSKMKILEYVLKGIKTPVTYLNISRLTDYRKDGHPSIYRPDFQAAQQEVHAQDCSHWCLPGVPDSWNDLLYVSLLKSGRGSWRDNS